MNSFGLRNYILCILLAGFLITHVAASGPTRVVTLKEAVNVALERNKDIQKAKEFRNVVHGRYIQERSAALPHLTVTSGISHQSDGSQSVMFEGFDFPTSSYAFNAEVGFTQALYTWGQVGAAIHAAKEGVKDAEVQLEIYRQAVVRDVSAAFYDILLARELLKLAQENRLQKERHLDEARRRFQEGVATDYDVLAAEVAVQNASPEIIKAENMIRIARDHLGFLLGLDNEDVDVVGDLRAEPGPIPPFDLTQAKALDNRPELKEIGHRLAIYKDAVKIYAAGDKPRLDLTGGAGWRELWMGGNQGGGWATSVGIRMTFPAFDGGYTKGKVIQARSDVESTRIEEARLRDAIAVQVRDALSKLRESSEILKALHGTVTEAEKLLKMSELGFQYGVKTRLEVDDAQQNVNAVRFNLAKARRDLIVAGITLDWVTGTLDTAGK